MSITATAVGVVAVLLGVVHLGPGKTSDLLEAAAAASAAAKGQPPPAPPACAPCPTVICQAAPPARPRRSSERRRGRHRPWAAGDLRQPGRSRAFVADEFSYGSYACGAWGLCVLSAAACWAGGRRPPRSSVEDAPAPLSLDDLPAADIAAATSTSYDDVDWVAPRRVAQQEPASVGRSSSSKVRSTYVPRCRE